MPVKVTPRDVSADLADVKSVLVASCPVCPPMCAAMQKDAPFIELFKHGIKTPAFEEHIDSIRDTLTKRRVRTGTFTIHTPTPMMCLWTQGQRKRFLKRAREYDAALIMACDSGTESAMDALEETECKVVQGLDMEGVINATTSIRFPLVISMKPRRERADQGSGQNRPGGDQGGMADRDAAQV